LFGAILFVGVQGSIQIEKRDKILKEIAVVSKESAIRAKKKEPVYITLPGAKTIRAIVDDYSKTSSIWTIVSKTHSIPIDYAPSPIKIPDVLTRTDKSDVERSVRSDIEKPLIDMFTAASADGYNLMIGSGYRPASLQKIYFDSYASSAGIEAANQYVAYPGQSEHQTGLAVDITTVSRNCYLTECFADTSDGQWLANNSYKYGFTLRYPKGKESITGYQYEPWHFRYVGIDLATALYESELTLDEAWQYLQEANDTLRSNGAI
jgi:D-alanyl-D-alanine carboxypeptidase